MRLTYFGAPYCGMCKAIKKATFDVLQEEGYDVEFVDCTRDPLKAEKWRVKTLPTVIVLRDTGEVFNRFEGNVTLDVLRKNLDQ